MAKQSKSAESIAKHSIDPDKVKKKTQPSIICYGGTVEIGIEKLDPIDIETYDLSHPTISRGVDIKADEIFKLGWIIDGGREDARNYIKQLFEDSDFEISAPVWVRAGYKFGNGYYTLLSGEDSDEIVYLKIEHPVYFGVSRYSPDDKNKPNKFKVDEETAQPQAYSQYTKNLDYEEDSEYPVKTYKRKTVGSDIKADEVAHIKFQVIGDEVEGTSIYQRIYRNVDHLRNIEEAGAKTMYNFGFNKWWLSTPYKSEKEMKALGKSISKIDKSSVILLPDGISRLDNIVPGTTEFEKYHAVFTGQLAIALGIAYPRLTLNGTTTNKATYAAQQKDIIKDLAADIKIIEHTVYTQIIQQACKSKFGEDFKEFPTFRFNEPTETKDEKTERLVKQSMVLSNVADSVETLSTLGKNKEADTILAFFMDSFKQLAEADKVFNEPPPE